MRRIYVFKAILLGAAIGVLSFGPASFARDLHGKFGLGYNSEFSNSTQTNGVPAVSLKYGMTRDIDLNLIFGINTGSPTNSVTALKFFKNIFFENNLNFYFLLAGGILSANSASSFEFLSGFGAEFFIPGIESMGLLFETGVSFTNLTGSFALKTLGASFLNAGIHFYF